MLFLIVTSILNNDIRVKKWIRWITIAFFPVEGMGCGVWIPNSEKRISFEIRRRYFAPLSNCFVYFSNQPYLPSDQLFGLLNPRSIN